MTLAYKHLGTDSSGDTAIAGTGLRVYTVLGRYQVGDSPETIADDHEIPMAAVYEALAYALDHPEEMEAITQANLEADHVWLGTLPEHLREMAIQALADDERQHRETLQRVKEMRSRTLVS